MACLALDTPQHLFHTSIHNWNHSSCPALAEVGAYFLFFFLKTFFFATQATNLYLSFLFQQSYVSSGHQMAPPSPNTNSSSNSSGGGGEQLSKTNLYIRGLHPGTTDQDLVKLCQPWVIFNVTCCLFLFMLLIVMRQSFLPLIIKEQCNIFELTWWRIGRLKLYRRSGNMSVGSIYLSIMCGRILEKWVCYFLCWTGSPENSKDVCFCLVFTYWIRWPV